MKKNLFVSRHRFGRKLTSLLMLVVFSLTTILFPVKASAQSAGIAGVNLPAVGSMMGLSESFQPAIIRGMTVYPDNPLKFDFIINTGDDNLKGQALEQESRKMIKYFLASLTTPENEFWVNLSPYEKDRIIPEALGVTEMGRDMLAQDYILKQLTASLLYPEKDLGNKFWQRVHEKAKKLYGVSEIPVDTFNKVWIMPDKASVYENDNRVFVVERHLKIMLEQDYMALENNAVIASPGGARQSYEEIASSAPKAHPRNDINKIGSDILRELIIPEIEKEVNEGKNFAAVRQIYNSMILATWYKKRLKESLLGQVYVNQNKVKGIDLADRETKQKIYEQYLAAFKKGVYNYIKEDVDALTNEPIPTKYFSGGLVGIEADKLRVHRGSLESQPKVVSAAVTGSLTDKGGDVVVSSSLIENATQAVVQAATSLESTMTALATSASLVFPPSPFVDSASYRLTGGASQWSVSMGGIVDQVQGLGFDALTMFGDVARFTNDHGGITFVGIATAYALLIARSEGVFDYLKQRKTVQFNLVLASEQSDSNNKRYTYLNRIIARGSEVIPELLEQFQQPQANQLTLRDVAYVLGKLKAQEAIEPLGLKLEQQAQLTDSAFREIVLALGTIGNDRAKEILRAKIGPDASYQNVIFTQALGKSGDESAFDFLRDMTSSENRDVKNAAAQALAELNDPQGIELVLGSLEYAHGDSLARARRILRDLGNRDYRIQLFEQVYRRIRWTVGFDKIDQYIPSVSEAYRIRLHGGEFLAVYTPEHGEDPIDFGDWDNGDHPLTPQYRTIVPESLAIIVTRQPNTPTNVSSAIIEEPVAKAVIWFGRRGLKGTIPYLLKLLEHDNNEIRLQAEEVLNQFLGTSKLTKEQFASAYIGALKSFEVDVQLNAITQLGKLRDPIAVDSLKTLLLERRNQLSPTIANVLDQLGVFSEQDLGISAKTEKNVGVAEQMASYGIAPGPQEFLISMLDSPLASMARASLRNLKVSSDTRVQHYDETVQRLIFATHYGERDSVQTFHLQFRQAYRLAREGHDYTTFYNPVSKTLIVNPRLGGKDMGSDFSVMPSYEAFMAIQQGARTTSAWEISRLLELLSDGNETIRLAVEKILPENRSITPQKIAEGYIRALQSGSQAAELNAIRKLGELNNKDAVWPLQRKLIAQEVIAQAAIEVLGKLDGLGSKITGGLDLSTAQGRSQALFRAVDLRFNDLFLSAHSKVKLALGFSFNEAEIRAIAHQVVEGGGDFTVEVVRETYERVLSMDEVQQINKSIEENHEGWKSYQTPGYVQEPQYVSYGAKTTEVLPPKLVIREISDNQKKKSASAGVMTPAGGQTPTVSSTVYSYEQALTIIQSANPDNIPVLLDLLGHKDNSIHQKAMGALQKLNVSKEQIASAYLNAWPNLDSWGKLNPLNWYPEVFEDARFIDVLSEELQSNLYGLRVKAREVLFKLAGDNQKIRFYDNVVGRLRTTVPVDVDFKVFEKKVLEAYRIVLSGDDFTAEYVQRMRTEYDYSGIYDTYSEPADPDHREYEVLDVDSLTIKRIPKTSENASASALTSTPVGGIDFNSAALDLQIKRDGNGVPLPLPQQTIENMKIDGFYPVIINIAPVNIPMLLGQKTQKQPEQLTRILH